MKINLLTFIKKKKSRIFWFNLYLVNKSIFNYIYKFSFCLRIKFFIKDDDEVNNICILI